MIGILSPDEIKMLLQKNYIGSISCTLNNKPYLVPFTFYYDEASNSIISYTSEGKKIDILRQNPQVCISVTQIKNLTNWKSVLVEGKYEELNDLEAVNAIRLLITNLRKLINDQGVQNVEHIEDFSRHNPNSKKVVYRVKIDRISGRYERNV